MNLEIISISLAAVSLGISIWVLFKNRKRIEVYFDSVIELTDTDQIRLLNPDGTDSSYGAGFLCSLKILNPSPNDIAYFDLRAFPTETNINSYLLTTKSLNPEFKQARVYNVYNNEQTMIELEIPKKNHGVLKANSFTHFDIFIHDIAGNEITNEITLSFKIAKKALFKDPYAVTARKKYKYYGIQYNVRNPENQAMSKEQR